MKGAWDLPADCNDGELFAYAEVLCDRNLTGAGGDELCAYLADVQTGKLGLPPSDAYRTIVDQAVASAAKRAAARPATVPVEKQACSR